VYVAIPSSPPHLPHLTRVAKAAALMTQNTVLEQEMVNYRKYMKTTVEKNQKLTKKLKKQLGWWKEQAASKGVTEACPF
jgi:hypothetical protein